MKRNMKRFLTGLMLVLILMLLPTTITKAASASKMLKQDNKWIQSGKYYVKFTDKNNLYVKTGSNGASKKVSGNVRCATVSGTTLVYAQEISSGDVYSKIKKYNMTSKKSTTIYTNNHDWVFAVKIAVYGDDCHVAFFCGECGGFHTSKHSLKTKAVSVSPLSDYTFDQNGTNLVCIESTLNKIDGVGKLRLYSLSQKKFIKTISNQAVDAVLVDSTLYFIRKKNLKSDNPSYEMVIASPNGTGQKSYPIKNYESMNFSVFAGNYIVYYREVYNAKTDTYTNAYYKYNFKTGKKTTTTKSYYESIKRKARPLMSWN